VILESLQLKAAGIKVVLCQHCAPTDYKQLIPVCCASCESYYWHQALR